MLPVVAAIAIPLAGGVAGRPGGVSDPLAAAGYRIERLLGRGRSARVYLAQDRRGCRVALKVVERRSDDDAATRQIVSEHALLSRVHDRHVVSVREHRIVGELAYLSMDYVPGATLRERLCRPLAPAHAVRLLREAAKSAAAAHRAGVVHRDLKPDNLIVRCDGSLVLTDFSVAARVGDEQARTAAGALTGTAAYAAPEQVQGEAPAPAADVYSLGVMFHEMLCGRRPFAGATPLELIAQHLVAPVPRLPSLLARYQPMLDRMLDKRPQHRPRDAAAVLHQIQALAPSGRPG
jgi:eukaryotic-like serine/threonine-protein kinase